MKVKATNFYQVKAKARAKVQKAKLVATRNAWKTAWDKHNEYQDMVLRQAKRDYFIQGMAMGCLLVVITYLVSWL